MRMRRFLTFAIVACACLVPHLAANAQAPQQSAYIVTVSPVRLDLSADPGSEVTATVTVLNSSTASITLQSSASDFVAQDDGGKPQFVPADSSEWAMSRWVSAEPRSFTLGPSETASITVRVAVPTNAEPGGHYAAVFFESAPSPSGQTSVVAKVGTLMLLRVSGKIVESGRLALDAPWLIEPGRVGFAARFDNDGNAHVKPAGSIRVTRLWGGTAADLPAGGENALPKSTRTFDVAWRSAPIGVYVAQATMRYGEGDKAVSSGKRYLVVLPWKTVLGGLAVFALGVGTALVIRRKKD
jgi:hypothetical protein